MLKVRLALLGVVSLVCLFSCSGGSEGADVGGASDVGSEDVGDLVPAEMRSEPDGTVDGLGDVAGDAVADEIQEPDVADVVGDQGTDDSWTSRFGTACEAAKRVGTFQVGLKKYGSEFSGRVYDSVDFSGVPTLKQGEAECQIMQRKPWFCDPACESGLQCNDQQECIAMPIPMDVGSVSVSGLTKSAEVEADAGLNYTFLDFDDVAFEPGAAIELVASGVAEYEVSLQGQGVEALELESTEWTLTMDAPLEVNWTAGSGDAEIVISLNVDQHGSTPATLVCRVADTGTYTIPAKMVKNLLLYGVNGAPTAYVFRRTVDSTPVPGGCLEFEVYSQVNLKISVEQ